MKAKLMVRSGSKVGQVFTLSEGDRKVIGRDPGCDIQIPDKGISRNHSLIEDKGESFLLVDLGSTNGTHVNDKIIITKLLENGDHLRIGQTELDFFKVEPPAKRAGVKMLDDQEQDLMKLGGQNTIYHRFDPEISFRQVKPKVKEGAEELPQSEALATIYEVNKIINSEYDLASLFEHLMNKVMDVFHPDRGFLILYDRDKDDFDIKVALSKTGKGEETLSRTILKKAIDGDSILSSNAMMDDRFMGGMSILIQEIQSVMCVPLKSPKKTLGAIYIDSIGSSGKFSESHLELLSAIGTLSGIVAERTMFQQDLLEKEKMQKELQIAQNIQKSLLPQGVPEDFPFDVVGWNLTCDETGGDYYDFIGLSENKLGIAIGDVSGHGIGAALLMATARAFLRSLVISSERENISEYINMINNLLENDMEEDKFMTLFYGELDTKKLTLRYANAGHDAPIIYRSRTGQFEELESTGIPLGMMADFEYEEGQVVKIERGDILVLTTDGITESMNPEGEQFERKRLMEVIQKGVYKSAYQIIKDCYESLQQFCNGRPQRDDLTLVVIKFQPKGSISTIAPTPKK